MDYSMVLNGRWTISSTIFTIFNKDINSQWTWKTLRWLLLLEALFLPAWWRDPNDDSTRRGALAECTFGFCALRHGLAWIRGKPQNYKTWASRSSPSDAFRLKYQLVTLCKPSLQGETQKRASISGIRSCWSALLRKGSLSARQYSTNIMWLATPGPMLPPPSHKSVARHDKNGHDGCNSNRPHCAIVIAYA